MICNCENTCHAEKLCAQPANPATWIAMLGHFCDGCAERMPTEYHGDPDNGKECRCAPCVGARSWSRARDQYDPDNGGELLQRIGRNGKTESVDGNTPPLSTEQQRARIRIAALVLEAQLVARIKGGEHKTPHIAAQVQSVQEVLGRVGREPGRDDKITIKEHHVRLAAALAAVEGSDETEGLSA